MRAHSEEIRSQVLELLRLSQKEIMANPNPQHNPTDGKGVAAYVQVTGTNVVNNTLGPDTTIRQRQIDAASAIS